MKYKLNQGVSVEKVEGNSILITEQGDAAVLNETGDMAFSSVMTGASEEETICMMTAKYGEDAETVKEDVKELLTRLVETKFIKPLGRDGQA